MIWGLFQNEKIDPTSMVYLVEDTKLGFAGYLWFPGDAFIAVSDPDWPDQQQHLQKKGDPPAEFSIEILEGDAFMEQVAEAEGYSSTGTAIFQLSHRSLDVDTGPPRLADGAVVRAVQEDRAGELEARVALHRDVWASAKFSLPGYQRLRQRPVYRPDLDLIAVAPDGGFAAYAIVWLDPETLVVEFEPVGSSPQYRQQGYASAVMVEGLRRARALGAKDAIVFTGTDERYAPARRLYTSQGFRVIGPCQIWKKPVPSAVG